MEKIILFLTGLFYVFLKIITDFLYNFKEKIKIFLVKKLNKKYGYEIIDLSEGDYIILIKEKKEDFLIKFLKKIEKYTLVFIINKNIDKNDFVEL